MDILLTLGEVIPAHTAHVLNAIERLLGRGVPLVVNIPPEYATERLFEQEFALRHPNAVRGGSQDTEIRKLEREFISDLLGAANSSDVIAVLFGLRPEQFAHTSTPGYNWVMELLDPGVAVCEIVRSRLQVEGGPPLYELTGRTRFESDLRYDLL